MLCRRDGRKWKTGLTKCHQFTNRRKIFHGHSDWSDPTHDSLMETPPPPLPSEKLLGCVAAVEENQSTSSDLISANWYPLDHTARNTHTWPTSGKSVHIYCTRGSGGSHRIIFPTAALVIQNLSAVVWECKRLVNLFTALQHRSMTGYSSPQPHQHLHRLCAVQFLALRNYRGH